MQQTSNFNPSARISALSALAHCLDKRGPLDAAWAEDRYFAALSPPDRGFAQLIAKTVLRRIGQIDDILKRFIERPLDNRSARIMHILRMGTAQLIWLETPPHAAVNESVEMTKQVQMQGYSGLVNAVLKKVVAEGRAIADAQDAAKLNTPPWLWESWVKAYGEETTRNIAGQHLHEPPLDMTVKENPDHWAKELGGALLPTGSVRLTEARAVTQLPGFPEGAWWVQDTAASIPARLLGDIKGKRVIDICAAPGGKTAQLAVAGAKVTAVDVSKGRVAILKTNMHRLGLEVDYVASDALKWSPDFTPDAILLDAPCSATGTLRRHPDVAWNRQPDDVKRLCATQNKLLRHALNMLKPGGQLVYAVCSLQSEEGEGQITNLLAKRNDAVLEKINIPALADYTTARGEIRTLPCYMADSGGMDGFYAALLTKKQA